MEKIKSFKEFVNESNSVENITNRATKLAFNYVYESETGEITISVNEGFVQDLQMHIRKTIDFLIKDFNIKQSNIDKYLEKNLVTITSSFQSGDSPKETAEKITA